MAPSQAFATGENLSLVRWDAGEDKPSSEPSGALPGRSNFKTP